MGFWCHTHMRSFKNNYTCPSNLDVGFCFVFNFLAWHLEKLNGCKTSVHWGRASVEAQRSSSIGHWPEVEVTSRGNDYPRARLTREGRPGVDPLRSRSITMQVTSSMLFHPCAWVAGWLKLAVGLLCPFSSWCWPLLHGVPDMDLFLSLDRPIGLYILLPPGVVAVSGG